MRGLARRGFEVAWNAILVGVATLLLVLTESWLPSISFADNWAGRSTWDIVFATISRSHPLLLAALGLVSVLGSSIRCWFTSTAFRFRGRPSTDVDLLTYTLRFLVIKFGIYLLVILVWLATVFIAHELIFAWSAHAEKIIVLAMSTLLWSTVIVVLEFVLYWSGIGLTGSALFRSVVGGFSTNIWRSYIIFVSTSVVGIVFGIIVPIVVLRTNLSYMLKLVAVGILVTLVIMWVRGLRFEYNRTLFNG